MEIKFVSFLLSEIIIIWYFFFFIGRSNFSNISRIQRDNIEIIFEFLRGLRTRFDRTGFVYNLNY